MSYKEDLYNLERGVNWTHHIPFVGANKERVLRENAARLIGSDPRLSNYKIDDIVNAYKAGDRGFIGHFGVDSGHQGQIGSFKKDLSLLGHRQEQGKKKEKEYRQDVLGQMKELEDFRYGNEARRMELGFGFQNQMLDRQQGFVGEQNAQTRAHALKLANLQNQTHLQGIGLSNKGALDAARLQGQLNLQATQMDVGARRYDTDQRMLDSQRERQFKTKENQENRRFTALEAAHQRKHQRVTDIYSAANQATAGRRQMIANILS